MLQRESFLKRRNEKPEDRLQKNVVTSGYGTPAAQIRSALAGAAAPNDGHRGIAKEANRLFSKADDLQGSRLIVGAKIRLKGLEVSSCDTLVVAGDVEATIDGRLIQIAPGGALSGTACVEVAEIHGVFSGELTVRKCLTICATGKVSGKIRYANLVIEEGGEISGDVEKSPADENSLRAQHLSPAGMPSAALLPIVRN